MKEEQNAAQEPVNPQERSSDSKSLRDQSQTANQTENQSRAEEVEEAERASDNHEGKGTGARAGEYS